MALVIGNSAYQHTAVLPNPRNDAEAIAKLLGESKFDEVRIETDVDYRSMREAARLSGEVAQDSDIAPRQTDFVGLSSDQGIGRPQLQLAG